MIIASPNRLVVVETIYHQADTQQPTAVEGSYDHPLESNEPPYHRTIKVGEEWQPLELGWASRCSMLSLRNEEGKFKQIPTLEERADVESRVIEVCLTAAIESAIEIPVGRSARFTPLANVMVRCRKGTASLTVSAYPR